MRIAASGYRIGIHAPWESPRRVELTADWYHLLESGTDIRIIEALLDHSNLQTTARYTQVANSTIRGTANPLIGCVWR